jgi:hypothetical protein
MKTVKLQTLFFKAKNNWFFKDQKNIKIIAGIIEKELSRRKRLSV